ncbi:hypothetical protein JCM10213_007168 [Rhodosporidiobolus nylandii]
MKPKSGSWSPADEARLLSAARQTLFRYYVDTLPRSDTPEGTERPLVDPKILEPFLCDTIFFAHLHGERAKTLSHSAKSASERVELASLMQAASFKAREFVERQRLMHPELVKPLCETWEVWMNGARNQPRYDGVFAERR